MKISYDLLNLELKFPFTIARYSRTSTPILLLRLNYNGVEGIGEASMVPYMGESFQTATSFLKKVDFGRFTYPFNMAEIVSYLDSLEAGLPAIKAAIDIALYDITGKIERKSCYQLFHADAQKMPLTTYTVGIDTPQVIVEKVEDALANGFQLIKIKIGRDSDRLLIDTIRSVTNLPLYVDANQGWDDKVKGVEMTHWLQEQGVMLIEQPMDKSDVEGNAYITEHSPIPIIGDEAVQRLVDVERVKGVYHGINVKLMKSAGMYEAFQMMQQAKSMGMKLMIGCMSETSAATLAGASLAPLCDFADLDGPFLTTNNPFKKPEFKDGRYVLSERPGLGIERE
ncbi:dipeptide epimerase [Pseudopedobacter beijingensis]|uniref:Dipeptide epimerase n=1 Tax=Pseudopedobacter beijingensis TaxID=1207056 RepID=A0ABW4IB46_9SPHI